MKKAKRAAEASRLEQIPNVGTSMAKDLRSLGISTPAQLKGKDGIALYYQLERIMGQRHDPCVADIMMAAVDFMNGAKPKPWWKYTKIRKKIINNDI